MGLFKKIKKEVYKTSGQSDKDEIFTLANQNHLNELDAEGKQEYLKAAGRLLDLKYDEVD